LSPKSSRESAAASRARISSRPSELCRSLLFAPSRLADGRSGFCVGVLAFGSARGGSARMSVLGRLGSPNTRSPEGVLLTLPKTVLMSGLYRRPFGWREPAHTP
jgi:hypothetical protein